MSLTVVLTRLASGVVTEERTHRKGNQTSATFTGTITPELGDLLGALERKELHTTEGRVVQIEAHYDENETYTERTLKRVVFNTKVMV
jgi:hypothetical protein